MGIKTTYNIDRQTAIAIIVSKINECSNKQIGNMLEEFDESYFRNYWVTDQLEDDPNEIPFVIEHVSEF